MPNLRTILLVLAAALCNPAAAGSYDRTVSIGGSRSSAETDAAGKDAKLAAIIRAMDRATNSSTRILQRPFPRSLKETAAGYADFHIPFIDNGVLPAPEGLAYVKDVDFGEVFFVIYSKKANSFDANSVAKAKLVEVEPGHEAFFPFAVTGTLCVSCSLDQILQGRLDALIVSEDLVDPLLHDAKYGDIHRALYAGYPVRALVPAGADSEAVRRYLIDGVAALKRSGELWSISSHSFSYPDWQP